MRFICICCYIMLFIIQLAAAAEFQGYQYLCPRPNSTRVSPEATIIVRFDNISPKSLTTLQIFRVEDERGMIGGTARLASDERTLIFQPEKAFSPGSTVQVTLAPRFAEPTQRPVEDISFTFAVTNSVALETFQSSEHQDGGNRVAQSFLQKPAAGMARIMPNGVSVPSDFPHINVTTNSAPGDGYIFLNNRGRGTPYNIIFDNDGSPVWYLRTSDRRRDFKVQRNGTISMLARTGGHRFLNFDKNFNFLTEYSAVDGYSTDEHECVILENGNVLLIGIRSETVDMIAYVSGGKRNATVHESIIQEFTADGDKIFEWRAWDNFDPADIIGFCDPGQADPRDNSFRFPHMNAIDIDDDGHILLSSRHLSEVSKINRDTGEFIWRLGGANNEFEFVNDELDGITMQHAVLVLGDKHYTVFDNGNLHDPPQSRGVEYELDLDKMTATLVWEYRNPPSTEFSHYMGNHQRLPNGNSLINWAVTSRPKATEVTPDGQVVYEMNWASSDECYRTFRCPWDGVVERPSLFVEQLLNDVHLIFNKFGDKDVLYYNIYGGYSPNATTLIDTSKKTLKSLTDLENNRLYHVRVTAVYADGSESAFSNEERVLIQKVEPGINLVPNSDFSQGKAAWTFEVQGSGDADWQINDGVAHFIIRDGGSPHHNVQLRQNSFPLITGQKYLFEFDAWADAPKTIEAKVGQDEGPWTNYSGIGLSGLARSKKHFSYQFTMEQPTDPNGRVVFNVGDSEPDVYLDNVTLKILSQTNAHETIAEPPAQFTLGKNYPNPFNASTTIPFHVTTPGRIRMELFDVRGRLYKILVDAECAAGQHQVTLDASTLTSGVYLYRLTALNNDGSQIYSDTQKMMLVK
ncbi:aryl-sulfate sulfotransferase [candidate division KSB1 bacterium]|nr:aryl-sulfate sulfotransferase [candidate division KSB1 bacterium]